MPSWILLPSVDIEAEIESVVATTTTIENAGVATSPVKFYVTGVFEVYQSEWHFHPALDLRNERKDKGTIVHVKNFGCIHKKESINNSKHMITFKHYSFDSHRADACCSFSYKGTEFFPFRVIFIGSCVRGEGWWWNGLERLQPPSDNPIINCLNINIREIVLANSHLIGQRFPFLLLARNFFFVFFVCPSFINWII